VNIDRTVLEAYRQVMGEDTDAMIDDLIATYLENTPTLIRDLRRSLEKGDTALFIRAAHTLKSSSAAVGAIPLSRLAAGLEQKGKENLFQGMETEVASMAALVDVTLEEFITWRRELNA